MIRLEFHAHTRYSKDSLVSPENLLEACREAGIQRIVVTDHNTIVGALHAIELDPGRVIIGEEIMTLQGELLAAYVQEEIPAGLPALETIEILRAQDAFISVSHPFDRMRSGHWELPDLLEILPLVDALEIFNARCMWPSYNRSAKALAKKHGIPGTVGSDAHALFEIGKATMLLPDFQDTRSLKQAVGSVRYEVSPSPPWVHLASRYASWRKKQGKS